MPRVMSLLAAFAIPVAVGCASMVQDNERTLAAAGFQMKFAQTPEQMEKLESLPQRTLTPVPGPDGNNRFIYADAKYCKCLYAGTEKAYDRYQRLAVKQRIAESREAATMDWGPWGGWGPWW